MRTVLRFLLVLGVLAAGVDAYAADAARSSFVLGKDYFGAGDRVETPDVAGDAIVAGGEVTVGGTTAGTVLAAGRNVRLSGPVQGDVYAAGGEITVTSAVDRNARMAGGTIRLESSARVAGNAMLAGGELDLDGNIGGYLLAAGGHIYVNGPVGGDVLLTGGDLELGPNARIAGKLRYRSEAEIKRDPAAQIDGAIERLPMPQREKSAFPLAAVVIRSIGLAILAAIFIAMLPAFTRSITQTASNRFGASLLTGFIALLAIPVACLVALVTLIGIPLGLILLLGYPLLLLIGYVLASIALGDIALSRTKPARAAERNDRIIFALLAILALAIAGQIPFLGGLIGLLTVLAGMGALLLQWPKARAAVG